MLNPKMIIGSTRPGRAALQRARGDGALAPAIVRQMASQGARR